MSFRPVPLQDCATGKLWLHGMPGRYESWSSFVQEAQAIELEKIVCLTPMHELSSLSPSYAQAVAQGDLPWKFLHLPMRNFGLALSTQAFRDGIAQLQADLRSGRCILIHCAAGIGRTGTVAACVLKQLGLSRAQALERVRLAGSDPQSAAQTGWIDTF